MRAKSDSTSKGKVSRRDSLKLTLALAIVCVCLGMPGFLFGQPVKEVKFGIIEPLSGPLASLGLQDKTVINWRSKILTKPEELNLLEAPSCV